MSYITEKDFYYEASMGRVSGLSIIKKFGAIDNVPTTLTPITSAGVYQTPTALTSLEMVSTDNTNDKSGGAGALTVRVIGIGTGYAEITEDVTLNGTTAVALSNQFYRVYRMFVTESGAYANSTTPSHNSTITLRVASAGATWAQINSDASFGLGQSLIACYSGETGYYYSVNPNTISVEGTKTISLFFFMREAFNTTSSPYSPMRVQKLDRGIEGFTVPQRKAPLGPFTGPVDIGFMAKTSSGTADVSINFEIFKEAI